MNIADITLTEYSFLIRYHYTKSKNYMQRRYWIRYWIPMFIGTPCILQTLMFQMFNNTKNLMVSKIHILTKKCWKYFVLLFIICIKSQTESRGLDIYLGNLLAKLLKCYLLSAVLPQQFFFQCPWQNRVFSFHMLIGFVNRWTTFFVNNTSFRK